MRGGTPGSENETQYLIFQSTHPMRGGTCANMDSEDLMTISIHPPHAGWDYLAQSCSIGFWISIHPPHAGWDPSICQCWRVAAPFQSTHPMRGGTKQQPYDKW